LAKGVKDKNPTLVARLKAAYDDLASTHQGIRASDFNRLVDDIGFLSPGITVKLVNGETDEDVAVKSPFNLFVGGNKLGRGVTIKTCSSAITAATPENRKLTPSYSMLACTGTVGKISAYCGCFFPRASYRV